MDRDASATLIPTGSHWGMWSAELRDGRVARAVPFAGDPAPSPLIDALPPMLDHPTRIREPMVRRDFLKRREHADRSQRGREPFVRVDWQTALALVADEIARVRARHGNAALYPGSGWASAGRLHNAKSLMSRFFHGIGGSIEPVTNYSFGAASIIVPHVVGTMAPVVGPLPSWPEIAQHTRLFVAFGGVPLKNLQINQGGVGAHDAAGWLRRAGESGVRFVYLGPQRQDVGDFLAAEWLAPKPGSDTAVMLGLAHTLATEGLADGDFLARCCEGYERFRAYLLGETDGMPKSAEWAAALSGLDAEAIRALARRMASTRTMLAASWSVQRAENGEQPFWALIALAAMLGQIGLPGGGFGFGFGAINGMAGARRSVPLPTLPTGKNPIAVPVPVARITDMLLSPGAPYDFNGTRAAYPDVRLMYWCGGNAFHQQQDLNRLRRAWQRPETVIVHDSWWTPTARHADIVLPTTTTLERNDIGASAFDRTWFAMKRAVAPIGAARNEFDIFAELSARLGVNAPYAEGLDEMGWLRRMYEGAAQAAAGQGLTLPGFDAFWQDGHLEIPPPETPAVPFAAFRRDPAANPLKTPSGRIELFSARIAGFGYAGQPGHPVWIAPGEWLGAAAAGRYPLHLLTNQPAARLHSQLDPGPVSRAAKIAGREPIRLNPEDAAARGIGAGDIVRVFNDRGACLAGAMLCPTLMRGVVQMATGAWFDPLETAAGPLDIHGNPNVLTRDLGTSPIAQSSTAQTCLVEIERYAGPAPALTVLQPPPILSEDASAD
ncbi:MAG: molybdopterin-dependent oxidoreductase [Rhodospirillaceae bacterium]|nr:molybdopterin-dependent oxidoreductase [Rhodospirillaceae bacterium]